MGERLARDKAGMSRLGTGWMMFIEVILVLGYFDIYTYFISMKSKVISCQLL